MPLLEDLVRSFVFASSLVTKTCVLVERPAVKWPDVFGDIQLFVDYPYLLPCTLAASITLIGELRFPWPPNGN